MSAAFAAMQQPGCDRRKPGIARPFPVRNTDPVEVKTPPKEPLPDVWETLAQPLAGLLLPQIRSAAVFPFSILSRDSCPARCPDRTRHDPPIRPPPRPDAERPGLGPGTRDCRTDLRLHQADRHGPARHRAGARLFRRGRAGDHAGSAGQLAGAGRWRPVGRVAGRADAGRPTPRRRHRLWLGRADRRALLDGPQRQWHHRLNRGLGQDAPACRLDGRRAPATPDRCRRPGAGGAGIPRPRPPLRHGHRLSFLDP